MAQAVSSHVREFNNARDSFMNYYNGHIVQNRTSDATRAEAFTISELF